MSVSLGSHLRQLRQKRGLSMNRLAGLAQISQSTISRWESGKFAPSIYELEAVLQQLDVSADERRHALSLINAPRAVAHLRTIGTEPQASIPYGGDLLRAMRLRKGWTLEQASQVTRIPISTLSRYEQSERWPSLEQLHTLCYTLGAHEDEIVALTLGGIHLTPLAPHSQNSLDRLIEIQIAEFAQLPFVKQDQLFDLFSLALEAQALSQTNRRDFSLNLAKAHAFRAQGLTHRGRIAEAEPYAYRVLNEVEIETADAWLVAWAIHTIAKGTAEIGKNPKPLQGVQVLVDWLPAVRQWSTAEEWFYWNMVEYLMEAGRLEEALAAGKQAMALHQRYGYMGTDDKLAYARLLTAAGQPEKSLEYLPQRQPYLPLQQAYDALAWAETLMALGQVEEAMSKLELAGQIAQMHGLRIIQPKINRLQQRATCKKPSEISNAPFHP
jgi:transcriptional regulator with XRE-family HTH domain